MKRSMNQNGFSLVELIGVLAIMGFLTALVLSKLADASDSGKSDQWKLQYTEIANNISNYFQPNYDFTGLTTAVAVQGNLVPQEVQRKDGSGNDVIQPPWGSASCSVAVDGARTDLFSITCSGMPIDGCAKDVAALDNTALRIEVGAAIGSVTTLKDLTAATPVPLNKATLATTCGGLGNVAGYTFRATHR